MYQGLACIPYNEPVVSAFSTPVLRGNSPASSGRAVWQGAVRGLEERRALVLHLPTTAGARKGPGAPGEMLRLLTHRL